MALKMILGFSVKLRHIFRMKRTIKSSRAVYERLKTNLVQSKLDIRTLDIRNYLIIRILMPLTKVKFLQKKSTR